MDRSTISGIVRRVAKNGLVQLNPLLSDNRAVTHSLTIDGLAVLNKSMKVLIENQAKLMAPIPISMRPIFIECLQRIAGFHVTGNDDMPELPVRPAQRRRRKRKSDERSEEHTSELQSLMRISYAVFCLKKKNNTKTHQY